MMHSMARVVRVKVLKVSVWITTNICIIVTVTTWD